MQEIGITQFEELIIVFTSIKFFYAIGLQANVIFFLFTIGIQFYSILTLQTSYRREKPEISPLKTGQKIYFLHSIK